MKEAYTKTDGVDHPLKAVLFLASPVSPLSSSGCTEDVRRDLGTMADRRSSTAPPLPPDPFACCCRVLRWGDSISGARDPESKIVFKVALEKGVEVITRRE